MKRLAGNVFRRATALLPPSTAARIDLLRPSCRESWGGPLNGQRCRRQIVRDLNRAISFDRVIETGTFRGTSTEFFAAVFGVPVESVEANDRFLAYSRARLNYDPTIVVSDGDSRSFLRRLAGSAEIAAETVFIYLDAHWEEDLPLREELEIIAASWIRAVVMIDDFQVPEDAGYGFDDYGDGKALTAGYLPELAGWQLLYPAAPSVEETGRQRGCAVLSSPALAERVRGLDSIVMAERLPTGSW